MSADLVGRVLGRYRVLRVGELRRMIDEEFAMPRIAWKERVSIDPDTRHGEPCIRGTRIPIAAIVGSLADGMSEQEIREAYPQLTADDIRAALAYAAETLRFETLAPLP